MKMINERLAHIPNLKNCSYEWAWDQHPEDAMIIVVYHWSQPVMSFFLGEAMESAGRDNVLHHVMECDRSPWLKKWQKEKQEQEHNQLLGALTHDYQTY